MLVAGQPIDGLFDIKCTVIAIGCAGNALVGDRYRVDRDIQQRTFLFKPHEKRQAFVAGRGLSGRQV